MSRLPANMPMEAWEAVQAWVPGANKDKPGLLLAGPNRIGKTRSVYVRLGQLHAENYAILAYTGAEFSLRCAEAHGNKNGTAWEKRLCEVEVLFIDDLDKARFTDCVGTSLYDIIETRTSWRRPIITTMNVKGDGLSDRVGHTGGAIVGRLRDFCQVANFWPNAAPDAKKGTER